VQYFNVGSLVAVWFFVLSLSVVSMISLFQDYVRAHWDNNLRPFPELAAKQAESQVVATMLIIDILALISALVLVSRKIVAAVHMKSAVSLLCLVKNHVAMV